MHAGILYEWDPGQGTDQVPKQADAQQHVDDEQGIAGDLHSIDDPRLMCFLHVDLDDDQQEQAEQGDEWLAEHPKPGLVLPVHISYIYEEIGYERVVYLPVVVLIV